MKNKKKTALIEMGKDGSFSVYTPDIEATIIGEGATVAEAKSDFENSVTELLKFYQEDGETIPEELQEEVLQRAVELAKIAWQGDALQIRALFEGTFTDGFHTAWQSQSGQA